MRKFFIVFTFTFFFFSANAQEVFRYCPNIPPRDAQTIELFRVAQLAWNIIEHLVPDAIITDTVDQDIFYIQIIRKNNLLFLDIKSSNGLWRREVRYKNFFVFWYPDQYVGGVVKKNRYNFIFYDLCGVRYRAPDTELSDKDDVDIGTFTKETNKYIFGKKEQKVP